MKLKSALKSSLKKPVNRGFAVLFILLGLMIVGGIIVLKSFNANSGNLARQQVDTDVLARAKLALLTKALSDGSDNARPGSFALPDYLAGNSPSTSTVNGQYDGKSTEMGCQDATKINGLPRIGTNIGGSSPRPNVRCLGRFPWVELGLDISLNKDFAQTDNQHDPLGDAPWYAVSANLVDSTCFRKLNPETLDAPVSSTTCSDTNPVHPWLTVHDSTGKIISDKIAAVILLAGAQIAGQIRTKYPNLSDSRQYLEGLTVNDATGCASLPGSPAAPCLISNSGLTNHFIQGAATDSFNDRLIYITVSELSEQLQKRVAAQLRNALSDYEALPQNLGKYPWLVPVTGSVAVANTIHGRLPRMSLDEALPSEFKWDIINGGTEDTPICVKTASTIWVRNPLLNTFQSPIANSAINFRNGSSGNFGICTWKNGALTNPITKLANPITNLTCEATLPAVPIAQTSATFATKATCEASTTSTGMASLSILRSTKIKISIDESSSGQCPPPGFTSQLTAATGGNVARLKGICTAGSVAGMLTVTDKYQSPLAPEIELKSLGAGANFEIDNMRISPVMPTWFGENGWHTQSFVFYRASNAPVVLTEPCTAGISVGASSNLKAAIVIAGAPTSAQPTIRPSINLADYFEGLQAAGTGCTFSAPNTTHLAIYNDTVLPIAP